ncbi:glycosyltransferase [Lederbergia citrea]|uniref:Glycosyltransferase n=1 Tax=Lederbergia citrea TaxID=2833581 RepID=A0A942UVN4_9BACI|nr:glycosyltransferase [Lederbergia citrea]MBS4205802.1 glycosyltransferase [Lederbergia citrea]MBS4224749.1 glycosyltransferase [Lederbergia citrea]
MKKIVIVTRRMVMGGIEKSLISMLKSIPKEKYDVTVLVMGTGGELEDEIPDHIKVDCLYGYEKSRIEKIWNYTKSGKFIRAFKIGWYTLRARMAEGAYNQDFYHSKIIPKIESEYDLAIAYQAPASFPVVFVMKHLRAKTKIAWIHCDVSQWVKELKDYKEYYEKYDKIFCVSEYAMNKFNNLFPNLKDKTSVFYNILDKEQLAKMAEKDEGFNDQYDGIRILTVGRLSYEKGQDIIPSILMKLRSKGINIRWYCIGEGESRPVLENLIKTFGLEEHLILLGTKKNPYNYIKQCDVYVQPSRHEGYCISLAEARAFNKPIVTTDFVGAREQIESGHNGLIKKFDENEIYSALITLISNPSLCTKFKNNLKRTNVNTTYEIKKLFESVG